MLKNSWREAIRSLSYRSGFSISRIPKGGSFGLDPFQDIAKVLAKPDPIVFDVGANVGQTVLRLGWLFPAPTIHCFEPSPTTFRALEDATRGSTNVTLNNIGLGDRPGQLTLLENSSPDMSSFLEPGDVWGTITERTEVAVSTVDAYCEEKHIDQIDFLKIDTQGYDYQVLRGASGMLSRGSVKFALCEMTLDEMYVGVERFDRVLEFMFEHKYALFGIYNQHWRHQKLSWADAVFVASDSTAYPAVGN